jgi:hypothetical protein
VPNKLDKYRNPSGEGFDLDLIYAMLRCHFLGTLEANAGDPYIRAEGTTPEMVRSGYVAQVYGVLTDVVNDYKGRDA